MDQLVLICQPRKCDFNQFHGATDPHVGITHPSNVEANTCTSVTLFKINWGPQAAFFTPALFAIMTRIMIFHGQEEIIKNIQQDESGTLKTSSL